MNKLKKQYNLEIAFVLPYSIDRIADFINTVPAALEQVEKWKNPEPDATLLQKERAELIRKLFQRKYEFKKGEVPTSLPILVDAERVVSKRLKLFTTNWDQVHAEQNIPTTFIIDKYGTVAFKYQSQITTDRPTLDYLESMLKNIENNIIKNVHLDAH